ncbi:MAG: carotenoid 1,2-hydratase [Gammaproteobacteria bacterium]|jgi:carotenoid 1,2-hydratase|nr:carotenoid 1,2-hydratase [Gammaproteobacteria bacterium]
MIPAFDQHVPHDGYAWWYIDAISDDGRHGLTLIAFIGSVFSPYYAWARGRGRSDPLNHCAINVALYGPSGRWSMTERGRSSLHREQASLRIGPSGLHWTDDALLIDLEEWAVPLPRRVRGRIRVHPTICSNERIELDTAGRHGWTPVWPAARVEVAMQHPGIAWSGSGYVDHNAGTEPLEHGFDSWSWSRAETRHGPVILYDTQASSGEHGSLALHFDRDGEVHELPVPRPVELPRSHWGIARPTRSEDGTARMEAVWEDTPFYARSRVNTALLGERVTAVHESLSLRRFTSPWVRLMLPFRMPRRSA